MKPWKHFIFIIGLWTIIIPMSVFVVLRIVVTFLPSNLELAILPIIVFIGFTLEIVWVLGALLNTVFLFLYKKDHILEFRTQKKISTTLFILALISPIIVPVIRIININNLQNKYEKEEKIQIEKNKIEDEIYLNNIKQKIDLIYDEAKSKIEGSHTIVNIQKEPINRGDFLMTVTLENGVQFYIAYWFSDWILKRFPNAIQDAKEFTQRDDLIGKTFTFTFYDRTTFEDILKERGFNIYEPFDLNSKRIQVLPPVEARKSIY